MSRKVVEDAEGLFWDLYTCLATEKGKRSARVFVLPSLPRTYRRRPTGRQR